MENIRTVLAFRPSGLNFWFPVHETQQVEENDNGTAKLDGVVGYLADIIIMEQNIDRKIAEGILWKMCDVPLKDRRLITELEESWRVKRMGDFQLSGEQYSKVNFQAMTVDDINIERAHVKIEPQAKLNVSRYIKSEGMDEIENLGVSMQTETSSAYNKTKQNSTAKVTKKRKIREDIIKSEKKLKLALKEIQVKTEAPEVPIEELNVTKVLNSEARKYAIDSECTELKNSAHIYCNGEDIYDVMLNQTNVEFNNNKYYLMQVLEHDDRNCYYVWFRWGRVGKKGQSNLIPCGLNVERAVQIFSKKFYDKTLNEFSERKDFQKVQGKYDLVHVSADETDSTALKEELHKLSDVKQEEKCDLRDELADLIKLICNMKKMEDILNGLSFDCRRSPLGKLSKAQIAAGFAALKTIEDCVSNSIRGRRLVQACNDFYTRIPHDFGMRTPPLIQSSVEIREKIELLETLADIHFAVEIIQNKIFMQGAHPITRQYLSLGVDLQPVDDKEEMCFLTNYLQNTHAPTHSQYKMSIKNAFIVNKQEEIDRFDGKLHNRMLLWHGSKLSNWASILGQGLRIAPPEAPCTGYMFGKGIYFADSSSKSANYCFPTPSQNEGILLLCEVALGSINELFLADFHASELPDGKHSVKGMGRVVPDKSQFKRIKSVHDSKMITVPCGELKDISYELELPAGQSFTLNYNEYIVYNVNQVKMRYILRVGFDFDSI